jgi:hypothetical protein
VVVLNLVFAQTLLRIMKIPLEHYDRFLSFRPVYAAIGGYTTFLFNPTGISRPSVTTVATVTVLVCAAVIMAENRRLALLAVAGIFLFFLPSSLTSLGSLDPEYIFKSVSRYLYLPSTMGMLLLALLATAIYRRLPKSVGIPAIAILLCLFTGYNYSQVKQRGIAWRNEGIPSRAFLQEMKRVFPAFPPNSHIFVDYPPFGRSYVVHALRAVYQEPAIHWIVDPPTFKAPAGSSVFMISCDWINNESVRIAVRRF